MKFDDKYEFSLESKKENNARLTVFLIKAKICLRFLGFAVSFQQTFASCIKNDCLLLLIWKKVFTR